MGWDALFILAVFKARVRAQVAEPLPRLHSASQARSCTAAMSGPAGSAAMDEGMDAFMEEDPAARCAAQEPVLGDDAVMGKEVRGGGTGSAEPLAGEHIGTVELMRAKVETVLAKDPALEKIQELKNEQAKLRAVKKKLTMQLRNEERKRQRLRKRASRLTDEDLVHVMMIRKDFRDARKGKATAAATVPAHAGHSPPAEDVA